MRIAAVVALFVAVLVLVIVAQPTTPAAGETVPSTATPCAGDCGPIITPRPSPWPASTPDPGCTDNCGPWPTPRPTVPPYETIEPANPGGGEAILYHTFMPIAGRR